MKIAVFASGSGSNFEAITEGCKAGEIPGEVVLCVCDRPGAQVESRAHRLGIPLLSLSPKSFADKEAYERRIVDELRREGVELVCLAGYMRIVGPTLLGAFPRRILNIHPSLLPAFKGKDAIRRAFEQGEKRFGATVHYVDETLDGGDIIVQQSFDYNGDDFEELERHVHKVEHGLYRKAIKQVIHPSH